MAISVPVGSQGDSMDRVLLRCIEVLASSMVVAQLVHSASAAAASGIASTSMSSLLHVHYIP